LKRTTPIPRQDSEFEAYYAISPISESGAPAGSEAGVRTPGSKDLPLTIEADDDDIDEDLPSTSPPVVEPRTPIQPSGAVAVKYPGVGIVRKKKKITSSSPTVPIQTTSSSLSSLTALLAQPPIFASVSAAQLLPAPGNVATTPNRLREMSEEDWRLFEEFRRKKRQKKN